MSSLVATTCMAGSEAAREQKVSTEMLSELRTTCDLYLHHEKLDLSGLVQKFTSLRSLITEDEVQCYLTEATLPLKHLHAKYNPNLEGLEISEQFSEVVKRKEFELQVLYRLFGCCLSCGLDPIPDSIMEDLLRLLQSLSTQEMSGFEQRLHDLARPFEATLPRTLARLYAHFELRLPHSLAQALSLLPKASGGTPKRKPQRQRRTPAGGCSPSALGEIQVNTSTARKRSKASESSQSMLLEDSLTQDENKLPLSQDSKSSASVSKQQIAQNVFRSIHRTGSAEPLDLQSEPYIVVGLSHLLQNENSQGSESNANASQSASQKGTNPTLQRARSLLVADSGNSGSGSSSERPVSRSASFDSRYFTIGGCTLLQRHRQSSSSTNHHSSSQGDSVASLTPPNPATKASPSFGVALGGSSQPPATPPRSGSTHAMPKHGSSSLPSSSSSSSALGELSPAHSSPHLLQTHMSPGLRRLLAADRTLAKETPPRKRVRQPNPGQQQQQQQLVLENDSCRTQPQLLIPTATVTSQIFQNWRQNVDDEVGAAADDDSEGEESAGVDSSQEMMSRVLIF